MPFSFLTAGSFRPGDRIVIKDLATQLNVSTTPLRETLARLAGRGVLEERRLEGYYLARLDARDVADFYSLHCTCVLRGLRSAQSLIPCTIDANSAWPLFASIAERSGDTAVIESRALLDDRLRIVRWTEQRLLQGTEAELLHLCTLVAELRRQEAAVAIRRFHDRRRAKAAEIATTLQRRQTSQ